VTTIASISADAKIGLLRQAAAARPDSSKVLLRLAEALAENGHAQEAADIFRRAYLMNPFVWLGRPGGAPERLHTEAAAMIEHGAIFSSTIAALAIGEALVGNTDAVKRLVDYDRFFLETMLVPPPPFALADFNAALAAEIKSKRTFFEESKSRARRGIWRGESPTHSQQPASRAFAAAIRREVERYIAALPKSADHPFVKSCPEKFEIRGWSNISDGASYHVSHIHGQAWASGVYYVVEPPTARDPDSRRGWLHVGPPEYIPPPGGAPVAPAGYRGVSTRSGWAERAVAPTPGRLVLMPGYFFHGTRPMGIDEERICVAFDVVPHEIAMRFPDAGEY